MDAGDYTVELTVVDNYGNPSNFPAVKIEVLSAETPKAVLNISHYGVDVADNPEIYEFETLLLDASESMASASGASDVTIESIAWTVLKDNVEFFRETKADSAAFPLELGEAGIYDFSFLVTNSNNGKVSSKIITLVVQENSPSISNLVVGEFFEEVEGVISFEIDEFKSTVKGTIESIALNIEGLTPLALPKDEVDAWDAGETVLVKWTPQFFGKDKDYDASFTVRNEANREFVKTFTINVKDNTPIVKLTLSEDSIMYGNTITFTATGSESPDGISVFTELSLEIFKEGVEDAVAVHDFVANMEAGFTPNIFETAETFGKYTAVLTGVVGTRTNIVSRNFKITGDDVTANFVINPDPENVDIFEGQIILLDASGSYDFDENNNKIAISDNSQFSWEIKKDEQVVSISPEATGEVGKFKLELTEGNFGSFTIELTVTGGNSETDSKGKTFTVLENKPIVQTFKNLTVQGTDQDKQIIEAEVVVFPDGDDTDALYNWYKEEPNEASVPYESSNSNTVEFDFVDDGADYTVYLQVINQYGLKSAVKSYLLETRDWTPPVAPILLAGSEGLSNDKNEVEWKWMAGDDKTAGYRYRLFLNNDSTPLKDWEEVVLAQDSVTLGELLASPTDGAYELEIQAVGEYGTYSASVSSEWDFDTTAPVISLIGDADIELLVGAVYTDAGATAADVYNGVTKDLTSSIVVSIKDGDDNDVQDIDTSKITVYTIKYSVSDAAGNTAVDVYRTVEFRGLVTAAKPVMSLDSEGVSNDKNAVEWKWTAGDANTLGYRYRLFLNDGETPLKDWTEVAVSEDEVTLAELLTSPSDGIYKLEVQAKGEGDVYSDSASSQWKYDTVAPVVSLIGDEEITLEAGETYVEPVENGITGASAEDVFNGVAVDLTDNIIRTIKDSVGDVVEGGIIDSTDATTYTIEYSVFDEAGNKGTKTRTVEITERQALAKPVMSVGSEGITNVAADVEWAWTWADVRTIGYRYRLLLGESVVADWAEVGLAVETVALSNILSSPADGTYTLEVQAKDIVNYSESASSAWLLDTTAPGKPSFTEASKGLTKNKADIEWEWSNSDSDVVGYKYRLLLDETVIEDWADVGIAVESITLNDLISNPADGVYKLEVQAKDLVNISETSSSSWTLDTTAPTITIPSNLQSVGVDIEFRDTSYNIGDFIRDFGTSGIAIEDAIDKGTLSVIVATNIDVYKAGQQKVYFAAKDHLDNYTDWNYIIANIVVSSLHGGGNNILVDGSFEDGVIDDANYGNFLGSSWTVDPLAATAYFSGGWSWDRGYKNRSGDIKRHSEQGPVYFEGNVQYIRQRIIAGVVSATDGLRAMWFQSRNYPFENQESNEPIPARTGDKSYLIRNAEETSDGNYRYTTDYTMSGASVRLTNKVVLQKGFKYQARVHYVSGDGRGGTGGLDGWGTRYSLQVGVFDDGSALGSNYLASPLNRSWDNLTTGEFLVNEDKAYNYQITNFMNNGGSEPVNNHYGWFYAFMHYDDAEVWCTGYDVQPSLGSQNPPAQSPENF